MSELSREHVRKAPQLVNPLKQRELSLRGLHLNQLPLTDSSLWTAIVANFDTLDLSDNLIQWLDAPSIMTIGETQDERRKNQISQQQQTQQIPKKSALDAEVDDFLSFLNLDPTANDSKQQQSSLPTTTKAASSSISHLANSNNNSNNKLTPIRLTTLILHKNGLKGISKSFANQFKNTLTSLVLHGNEFSDLPSCDVFGSFKVLERLSLVHNPVRDRQGYRLYVIGTCSKTLKLLDFQKVRDDERQQGTELKKQIIAQRVVENEGNANNNNGGAGDNNNHGGVGKGSATVGAGRRAARKAALTGATAGGDDSNQNNADDNCQKRSRNATEQQLTGSDNNVESISTRIGSAVADSRSKRPDESSNNNNNQKKQQQQAKKHTKEELMQMLESAETLEEMEEIERMMNELD